MKTAMPNYRVVNTGFEEQMLDRFRIRNSFCIFPFIFTSNGDYIKTGKWFSKIKIKQQASKFRVQHFDDGLTYQHFWGKWSLQWKTIDIVK